MLRRLVRPHSEPVPITQARLVDMEPVSSDSCRQVAVQPAVSPLLDRIESVLVDFTSLPPASLLHLELQMGEGVATPAEQVLHETWRHIRSACDFALNPSLYKAIPGGPDEVTLRRAGSQLKQKCSSLGEGQIAMDARYHITCLNLTLGPGACTGSHYRWGSFASNYISRALLHLEGDPRARRCTAEGGEYQRCSQILLQALSVTASAAGADYFHGRYQVSLVQDHIRQLLQARRSIHSAVPAISAAAGVLNTHPAVVSA